MPLDALFPPGPAGPPAPRDKLWQRRFVAARGLLPQPGFVAVDGTCVGPDGADLGDVLAGRPGTYILKPRFGSNGCGVVRVLSHPDGTLTAESDCPDTAAYLDDFPVAPVRRGRDVVAALATSRGRYLDRARAGIPEAALGLSILEDEIPADRAGGSVFEPRVVVQRAGTGFATLGAVCKRIDTPVGAVVARDFCEENLAASLARLLADRNPPADLPAGVARAHADILAAADRVRAELVPVLNAVGCGFTSSGSTGGCVGCRRGAACGGCSWSSSSGSAAWTFRCPATARGRTSRPSSARSGDEVRAGTPASGCHRPTCDARAAERMRPGQGIRRDSAAAHTGRGWC